jgi:RNA 2',3'-cyclic 3'-phosphodiesterase
VGVEVGVTIGLVAEQLCLPGFDDALRAADRLFFTVLPDEIAAQRIALLARHLKSKYRLQGRPIRTNHLHVSLYHLGDYSGLPPDVIARAKEAVSTVALPPFEIRFDRVVSFSGRVDPESPRSYPLVLRVKDGLAEVMGLRRALASAMMKVGLRQAIRTIYTPHLTLLYDQRRIPEHSVDAIASAVREFVLVHSMLGKTQHVLLEQWPLRGRCPVRSATSLRNDGYDRPLTPQKYSSRNLG